MDNILPPSTSAIELVIVTDYSTWINYLRAIVDLFANVMVIDNWFEVVMANLFVISKLS